MYCSKSTGGRPEGSRDVSHMIIQPRTLGGEKRGKLRYRWKTLGREKLGMQELVTEAEGVDMHQCEETVG